VGYRGEKEKQPDNCHHSSQSTSYRSAAFTPILIFANLDHISLSLLPWFLRSS
jgi:hypothetical protein